MEPSLLLFDIDATLLRTGGAGFRSMKRVAARLFGDDFKWDGVVASGSLDPIIFREAALLNGIDDHDDHHDRFRDHYIAELERELPQSMHLFEVMPGVRELLTSLHQRAATQRDIVLGLLTGNYARAGAIKLTTAGFDPDWFEITCFGDEAPTRPDLVDLAMQKYTQRHGRRPDPKRVIVIGDTPRDVECAKAHHCIAFAVATGGYSVEVLLEAGADVAVEDLSDHVPLLSLIG